MGKFLSKSQRRNKDINILEKFVTALVINQDKFDLPSPEDTQNVPPFDLNDQNEQLRHFMQLTELAAKLHMKFALTFEFFKKLTLEDRILLIKRSTSEVLILRAARRYDKHSDAIVFANEEPYTRGHFLSAHIGDFTDHLFEFCRFLFDKRVDNTEYALLTSIVLFSDHPGLQNATEIRKQREFFFKLLYCYILLKKDEACIQVNQVVHILDLLRTNGYKHAESFRRHDATMFPPLLHEIFVNL